MMQKQDDDCQMSTTVIQFFLVLFYISFYIKFILYFSCDVNDLLLINMTKNRNCGETGAISNDV
jgi:hypothetical protein